MTTIRVYINQAPVPEPLNLLSSVPADGATGISASANITLTFSRAVALGTGNITIKKTADDSTVEAFNVASEVGTGNGQVSASGAVVTLNPTSSLPEEGLYITVDATAVDAVDDGASFAGISDKTVLNFTVAASDVTAPSLSSLSPVDGATDVAINTNCALTYNEAIKWQSTVAISIRLTSDNTVIHSYDEGDIGGGISISGNTATINWPSDLSTSTGYYILVDGIEDLAGNNATAISSSSTWNFTTAASLTSTKDGFESTGAVTGNQSLNGMLHIKKHSFSDDENKVLEFSFPTTNAAFASGGGGSKFGGEVSEGSKSCARWWFAHIGLLTGITFFEGPHNSTTANIRVCRYSAGGNAGDFPVTGPSGVYISSLTDGSTTPGQFGWRTIGHEIGHAMGLKHPHNTELPMGIVPEDVDCQSVSIMSYRNVVGGAVSPTPSANSIIHWPQSYMELDILALRHMYGTGDAPASPVYTWSTTTGQAFIDGDAVRPVPTTNHVFECLFWDGECDLTAQSSPNVSDLTAIITDSGQLAALGGGNTAAANVFAADGTDLTAET
jgi:hypothetical protein